MSEYENRIFDTLTSSAEKFKSAYEIANHLNGVKKKLITQFWKNVEIELSNLTKENDEEFKVELDSNIFLPASKCCLYIENTKIAGIIYEHLANDQVMGLWFENPKFDIEKINKYRTEFGKEIINVINHTWWVSFKNINENFNNLDSLLMILPGNSLEYSKAKARDLFEYAVANKEHLKYIINNCLN